MITPRPSPYVHDCYNGDILHIIVVGGGFWLSSLLMWIRVPINYVFRKKSNPSSSVAAISLFFSSPTPFLFEVSYLDNLAIGVAFSHGAA